MHRRIILYLVLPALSVLAAACTAVVAPASAPAAGETAAAVPSGAAVLASTPVTVAVQALPASLDPYEAVDGGAAYMLMLLYDTPLTLDSNGQMLAGLVQQVAVTQDRTVYTFTLRSGVTFHDGAPLDAASVVAAWKRGVALEQQPWLAAKAVEAFAPDTVRVTLHTASEAFLDTVAVRWPIIREVQTADGQPVLVGSGPFASGDRTAGSLVLKSSTAYWRDVGTAPDQITLLAVPDAQAALQAVQSGAANLAFGFREQDLTDFAPGEGVEVIPARTLGSVSLYITGGLPEGQEEAAQAALRSTFDYGRLAAENPLMDSAVAVWRNSPNFTAPDNLAVGIPATDNLAAGARQVKPVDLAAAAADMAALDMQPDAELSVACVVTNPTNRGYCSEMVDLWRESGSELRIGTAFTVVSAAPAEELLPFVVQPVIDLAPLSTVVNVGGDTAVLEWVREAAEGNPRGDEVNPRTWPPVSPPPRVPLSTLTLTPTPTPNPIHVTVEDNS